MDELRIKAKQFKNKKEFNEAILIYEQIYPIYYDKWVGWEYSYCLKQLVKIDQAIEISKKIYSKDKKFKYNNDLLAWLLYEKYFKNLKDKYSHDEVVQLYNIALFVSTIISQDKTSPLEKILLKALRVLKRDGNNFEDKMIILLNKIDIKKLSTIPREYIDKKDKRKEYQSDKEMYYAYKSKALYVEQKYEECINCCEEALSDIADFHHDNDVWIQYRKSLSIGKLGSVDNAIEELKKLSNIKSHWVIFAEIARLYTVSCDNENALLYFCRAAITPDPPKMKVSMYDEMAIFLKNIGQDYFAYLHVLLSKNIRVGEGWNIPTNGIDLIAKLKKTEEEYSVQLEILQSYWLDIIYNQLTSISGIITNIHKNGKFGFIRSSTCSYYFKMTSVVFKSKAKENDKVSFCIIQSFDKSKNKLTEEAVYIKIDK